MISIYWGKPGDGMKLNGLKTYPKTVTFQDESSVTCPGAKSVTHQVANAVTSNRAAAQIQSL